MTTSMRINLPDDINKKVELYKIEHEIKKPNGRYDKEAAIIEMLRKFKDKKEVSE